MRLMESSGSSVGLLEERNNGISVGGSTAGRFCENEGNPLGDTMGCNT